MSKRRHEQFFGFAPDEIKPAAVLKKMRNYAADAGRPFAVRSATYQGMLPRSDDSRRKKACFIVTIGEFDEPENGEEKLQDFANAHTEREGKLIRKLKPAIHLQK